MGFVFGAAAMVGALSGLQGSRPEAVMLALCVAAISFLVPRAWIGISVATLAGLSLGYAVGASVGSNSAPDLLPLTETTIDGALTSDPRLAGRSESVEITWSAGDSGDRNSLLVYTGINQLNRGDRVEATGMWSDDKGEVFFADRVEVTRRAGTLERIRSRLRSLASRRVLDRTPGSNGSLALGLLLGDDSGLTRSERDQLRASGLSHITAVSGSNVALVIVVVAFSLRALNRTGWLWFFLQVIAIVVYVWIVGPDPPIVRAAIMGSLVLFAGVIGRPTHLLTLLALAGAAMTLIAPETLLTLSFQLSFLSMVGLALAGDIISRARGARQKIIAALLSPVGAALLTAPLLAARFGTLSLGTVPANVAVAPLITPATILTGMLAVLPDWLVIGEILGMIVWILTSAVLLVARAAGSPQWAVLTFEPLSNGQTLALYLLLGFALAPFIPEVRVAAFRLRRWARTEPPRAAAVLAASSTAIIVLAVLVD